jgi:aryl-alcohol dehydrogenase-like predicted oxidoreductase
MGDEAALATIKEAVELGFIDYDTAPHYGLGLSEQRTAIALNKYAYRFGRPVRLWTKVGSRMA